MAGEEVKIGPWPGGLNTKDPQDSVQDSQLVECVNFDISDVGYLIPRRALRLYSTPSFAGNAIRYLLGSITFTNKESRGIITAFDPFTGNSAFSTIKSVSEQVTFATLIPGNYKSLVQYGDKIWYIPGLSSSVGRTTSSQENSLGVFSTVATVPWGDYGFILKDRMFVVRKDTSELYFSKATDPSVWSAPDGGVIKVNPGDNQAITKVVVVNNQIIIFKKDQTFILSFTSSPTGDGTLRQVSPDQGAYDAVAYNNEVYLVNSRSVFKFINGFFQDIATVLDLVSLNFPNAKLHVISDTLMVSSPTFVYAMNLRTGAWTQYDYTNGGAVFTANTPIPTNTASITVFDSVSRVPYVMFGDGQTKLFYMQVNRTNEFLDIDSTGTPRQIRFSMLTKLFTFDDSMSWKRLFSWFFDGVFTGPGSYTGAFINVRSSLNTMTFNMNYPSTSLSAFMQNKSLRFTAISFGFNGMWTGGSANYYPLTIRGFKAVIKAATKVSKSYV